jgi:hypothetical protein
MSQITPDKLCLPLFGSACQMSQQIKCIRIQVDCRIHSKVIPEPIAPRFARPLIVKYLFNFHARLHQHQSKIKLSHVNRMSQQKAMIHFYDGSSQFIVRYIYSLDSEGAHTAIPCATKLLSEHLSYMLF